MKKILRIVGDCHGQYQNHRILVSDVDYSIQIGDYGFTYNWLYKLDLNRHRFFGGNHDNYNEIKQSPYNLGDFGLITHIPELTQKIFFVRGAWSIDAKYRTPGIDWWQDEELTQERAEEAIAAYAEAKPDILLSHEGSLHMLPQVIPDPSFAIRMGFTESTIKTRTNQMIDAMFEKHRPKMHIFGHYHTDFDKTEDGTRHLCVCRFEHDSSKSKVF